MIASIGAEVATAGVATPAVVAAKGAVVTAKTAAKTALDVGNTAQSTALMLKDSISGYIGMAENNLAAISTTAVEAQIAAKYGKGSPNYRTIARQWAAIQMRAYLSDMAVNVDTLIITTMDPSGILGTISAFSKPMCSQHTSIPNV
jgi:hypothetical protein